MAYRKLLIIIAGISSLIFFSCKDNPTDVGFGLLKNNLVNVKSLDSSTDSLKQTSSYFQKTIPLGNGTKLLLGNYKNVQGSVLLNYYFLFLPDSIRSGYLDKSVTIQSASVALYPVITYGDSLASFDFTVHQINSSWGTTTFDADSLPSLSYNAGDISSNRIITDSVATFTLDKSLVDSWLSAYIDSNYTALNGIYLTPTANTKKIIGFQSFSSLTGAYSELRVVFSKAGVYSDTISFVPVQDISVIKGTLPQIKSTEIAVQGGLTLNSKLWFDASKIPANAVINQATLTLTVDTLNSYYPSGYYNGVTLWNLSDSTANTIDSSKSVSLSLSGSTIQGDITSLVQKWIDNKINQGIIIQSSDLIEGVELYAIKGSHDPDLTVRPRLQIIYTTRN